MCVINPTFYALARMGGIETVAYFPEGLTLVWRDGSAGTNGEHMRASQTRCDPLNLAVTVHYTSRAEIIYTNEMN